MGKQTSSSAASADATLAAAALAVKRPPAAIAKDRVIDLAQVTGEPRQVVLENDRDPVEVLGDPRYWQNLPSNVFPVGCRFELTNDAGTFLFECWVRATFGTLQTGVRDIRFHHRVVWDEREDAVVQEFAATGRWEARYDGRFYKWRVYSPNGVVARYSFNDETQAQNYRREQESNSQGGARR